MCRRQEAGVLLIVAGVLVGLGIPVVLHVREEAARTQCKNNLRMIGRAFETYYETHGALPTGTVVDSGLPVEDRLSWMVTLLPYIGQKDLYGRVDLKVGWEDDKNRDALNVAVETYLCPGSPDLDRAREARLTHYVALTGYGSFAACVPTSSMEAGPFGYDRKVSFKDMKLGRSYVILVTETGLQNGRWAQAGDATLRAVYQDDLPYFGDDRPFGGLHSPVSGQKAGAHILMADGAVLNSTNAEPGHFSAGASLSDWW